MVKKVGLRLAWVYVSLFLSSFITGLFFGEAGSISINPQSLSWSTFFYNNVLVGLNFVWSGWLTFGIWPALLIIGNGFMIGNHLHVIFYTYGFSGIATGILPHAFFELCGLGAFAVCGFVPCYLVIYFFQRRKLVSFKLILTFLTNYLIFGVLFLFIASLIEGGVSFVKC
ncbi:MAG: hypothetical protein RLZ12_69 [Bacillota bacterium]|jgi:uncharacterized membrane protein SpoIIM required for sporulation